MRGSLPLCSGYGRFGRRFCRVSGIAGVTLLEILIALLIMAAAFIPLVGVIGIGATDTDVAKTHIFAQTTARNILDNLLDNVPFDCLRVSGSNVTDSDGSNSEAGVAQFVDTADYLVASYISLLGNPGTVDKFGRGELRDERGTRYFIKLFCFPLVGTANPIGAINPANEVTFRYLPRPPYETATNTAVPPQATWYSNSAFVNAGVNRPYDYSIGASPDLSIRTMNAFSLGVSQGAIPSLEYCVLKRILLRVRWVMPKGGERSIEIYTVKGNLARQDL